MPSWIFFTAINTLMLHQLHIDEFSILLPYACCLSNLIPECTGWNLDTVTARFNCHFVRLHCAELSRAKIWHLEWACSKTERNAPSASLGKAKRNKSHRLHTQHVEYCMNSPVHLRLISQQVKSSGVTCFPAQGWNSESINCRWVFPGRSEGPKSGQPG